MTLDDGGASSSNASSSDPYRVLNLPRAPGTLTPEQVKAHYKMLAKQLHPDKCGARLSPEEANAAFQALTAAYRAVMSDVRAHEAASVQKMKEQFTEFLDKQKSSSAPPPHAKKFSLASFNSQFERDRLSDPVVDAGYGTWMRDSDPEAAGDKQPERRMIVRATPEAVAVGRRNGNRGGCIDFAELGVDRVDDFGRAELGRLAITDYQVAHTTHRLIDDEMAAKSSERPHFKDLRSIEKHRAQIRYEMTPEEREIFLREEERERQEEERRRRVLERRDGMALRHFGAGLLRTN
jgi:curved DNA-binding protein CbpA